MGGVGDVVGVGHVHGDAVVGGNAVGGGTSAPQAHLLLNGKDEIQVVVGPLDALHGGEQDGAGDAVVQIGGKQLAAADEGSCVKYGGVPHLYHGLGLGLILSANVNVKVIQFPILGLHLPLDSHHAPGAVAEPDGGAGQVVGGQAAHLAEAQVAMLVDVGDDEADGVHVGGKHHPGAGALLVADQVAQGVGGDLVHIGGGQGPNGGGHLTLVARGAVAGVEGLHDL